MQTAPPCLPQKALRGCRAAIEIRNAVIDHVRRGVAVCELYQHSVTLAETLGYENAYLGPPGYKVTFIGHGIGLELIEPPIVAKNRKDLLEPGMTLALEPKIVFQNKFAAGIESVVCVTEFGARLISKVSVEIFIC